MNQQITMIQPAALKPYEKNPRKNDEAVAAVAASIREFGFRVPIICDADHVIICGHTRLKAAEMLGLEEIPVIVADDLTPEQVRAFRLADNKTAELAEWDDELLYKEIGDLPSFDWSAFGFELVPDEYGTEFSLPDDGKPEICQMTFTLHENQKELIKDALESIDPREWFGNTNRNGNALYEVVKQWAEQKTSS